MKIRLGSPDYLIMDRFGLFLAAIFAFSLLFPSGRALAFIIDVKPCKTCGLQRLVTPPPKSYFTGEQGAPSAAGSFRMPFAKATDESGSGLLRTLVDAASPKGFEGLTIEEISDVSRAFSSSGMKPGDVAASYESRGKVHKITYEELLQTLVETTFYGNTEAVSLMLPAERRKYLENIIKTNLLFEEGVSNFKKYESSILTEEEYKYNSIWAAAVEQKVRQLAAAGGQGDIDRAAREAVLCDMGFSLETEQVRLLRPSSAGQGVDQKKPLCRYQGGVLTPGDLKEPLRKNPQLFTAADGVSDADFFLAISFNILAPRAYAAFSAARGIVHEYKPYNEYLVYTLAEMVLGDHLGKVSVSARECQEYYSKNQSRYQIPEGIDLDYFVFGEEAKDRFDALAERGGGELDRLFGTILALEIDCDVYQNERFYKNQLPAEIESALFALESGALTKAIPLANGRFAAFRVARKVRPLTVGIEDAVPMVYREILEEKRGEAMTRNFSELYKKYRVRIMLN